VGWHFPASAYYTIYTKIFYIILYYIILFKYLTLIFWMLNRLLKINFVGCNRHSTPIKINSYPCLMVDFNLDGIFMLYLSLPNGKKSGGSLKKLQLVIKVGEWYRRLEQQVSSSLLARSPVPPKRVKTKRGARLLISPSYHPRVAQKTLPLFVELKYMGVKNGNDV